MTQGALRALDRGSDGNRCGPRHERARQRIGRFFKTARERSSRTQAGASGSGRFLRAPTIARAEARRLAERSKRLGQIRDPKSRRLRRPRFPGPRPDRRVVGMRAGEIDRIAIAADRFAVAAQHLDFSNAVQQRSDSELDTRGELRRCDLPPKGRRRGEHQRRAAFGNDTPDGRFALGGRRGDADIFAARFGSLAGGDREPGDLGKLIGHANG